MGALECMRLQVRCHPCQVPSFSHLKKHAFRVPSLWANLMARTTRVTGEDIRMPRAMAPSTTLSILPPVVILIQESMATLTVHKLAMVVLVAGKIRTQKHLFSVRLIQPVVRRDDLSECSTFRTALKMLYIFHFFPA